MYTERGEERNFYIYIVIYRIPYIIYDMDRKYVICSYICSIYYVGRDIDRQ